MHHQGMGVDVGVGFGVGVEVGVGERVGVGVGEVVAVDVGVGDTEEETEGNAAKILFKALILPYIQYEPVPGI